MRPHRWAQSQQRSLSKCLRCLCDCSKCVTLKASRNPRTIRESTPSLIPEMKIKLYCVGRAGIRPSWCSWLSSCLYTHLHKNPTQHQALHSRKGATMFVSLAEKLQSGHFWALLKCLNLCHMGIWFSISYLGRATIGRASTSSHL